MFKLLDVCRGGLRGAGCVVLAGWLSVMAAPAMAEEAGRGEAVLEELEAALDEAPDAATEAQKPDPTLVRRVILMDHLLMMSREAGQAMTATEAVTYFEKGMRPGFWEAGEGGQPTLAALGPVLVVWHTQDGHRELQAFIDQTVRVLRDTMDHLRAEEDLLRRRLARMRHQHDIPKLLVNFLHLRAVIEGRIVSTVPREQTEKVLYEVLSLLDEYVRLGGGGVVEAILRSGPAHD